MSSDHEPGCPPSPQPGDQLFTVIETHNPQIRTAVAAFAAVVPGGR